MGRVAVRAAVAAALAAAAIPAVGTVYAARDYVSGADYEHAMYSQAGSGAVLVVNLPGPDHRRMRALAGRGSVNDTEIHPVAIEVFLANTAGDPVGAQQDFDAIADAITVLVRNDPTLSAPDVIWSAGEYEAGVEVTQQEPFTDEEGTTVFVFGLIRFDAWEWIAGEGI
ncbi:MAG TPA: hypothetical protein VF288_10835 [Mycobacteriales bacterium]